VFDRIKNAIGKLVHGLGEKLRTRELKESELDETLEEFKISLVEGDVALDVAERVAEEIKRSLLGRRIDRSIDIEGIVREAFRRVLEESYPEFKTDIFSKALEACRQAKRPYVIVFFGVNGVGKTTSIAKVAYAYKQRGITPVIVAADTFRAGAQEQLVEHARRLGVPVVRAKYGSDPAAVAYDAVTFASRRGYCAVLVDTAGRMHTEQDLMDELRKIVRVIEPDLRVLVVDSLTGNDAVEQARTFNDRVGIDAFILTKTDADVKGGTALSIIVETGKPVLFVGTGQRYEDLEEFSLDWLLGRLLSKS